MKRAISIFLIAVGFSSCAKKGKTMSNLLKAVVLIVPMVASGQTVFRVDPNPVTTTAGNAPVGGNPALYAVAGSTVQLCTNASCTASASTYTDSTGSTACPTYAQVTLPGSTLCTSTTGPQGQFGFWIGAGTYWYKVTTPTGQTYGPYPMTTTNTAGVTNITAGTGISITPNVGSPVVTNTGATSFNGRTGAVTPQGGDYSASQVTNAVDQTQVYSNPTFINSLGWGKITGAPSFVVSFNSRVNTVIPQTGDYNAGQVTNAVDSTASYSNPSWITALAWSKLTGLPNFVNTFNGRTGAVTSASGDYTFAQIAGTKQGTSSVPQMAAGSFVSGHCMNYDANGNATDAGFACGSGGGGGGSVTSVFGQTGVVNTPVTTTDISTPANPSSGTTKWYTKNGVFCSLSPAGAENCVGGSSSGVSSLNSLTGALAVVGTSNEIIVTPSGSHVTLSTPQDIGTSSNVSFGTISGSGNITSTTGFYTGASPVQVIDGSQNGTFHNVTITGTCTGCGGGGGGITSINSQTGPSMTFGVASTGNLILSTNTGNVIKYDTVQNITTSSAPSFSGMTLTAELYGSAASGPAASLTNNDSTATLVLQNTSTGVSLQAYNNIIVNGGNSGRVDLQTGEFKPYTDKTVSLGDSTYGFKDANIHGVLYAANTASTATYNVYMSGTSSAEVALVNNSGSGYGIYDTSSSGSVFQQVISYGGYFLSKTNNTITMVGHVVSSGNSPTVSQSGGSCTLTGTDHAGYVAGCSSYNNVQITFYQSYASAPTCVVSLLPYSGSSFGSTQIGVVAQTTSNLLVGPISGGPYGGTIAFSYICD